MKFCRTRHQADQIDFKHLAKSAHLEFAAPVDHRALRQYQHVEPVEGRLEILDCLGIADVELRVVEALEMRSLGERIIGGGRAGAANMRARPWRGTPARCRCRCRWSRQPPEPACP